MKRITLLFTVIAMTCAAAMAQSKVLVAYFSATGNTERVAHLVAESTGGTLLEIIPEAPYSGNDLDWHNDLSRSSVEMNDTKARPAIVNNLPDSVASYDVIYLGYPIWWNQAPRVINTFLETYDLSGKTVIPFATSGGSSISNSIKELQKAYPNIKWGNGKLLNRATIKEIKTWTKQ